MPAFNAVYETIHSLDKKVSALEESRARMLATQIELDELLGKIERAYNRLYQRQHRDEKQRSLLDPPELLRKPPESRQSADRPPDKGEVARDSETTLQLRRRLAGY